MDRDGPADRKRFERIDQGGRSQAKAGDNNPERRASAPDECPSRVKPERRSTVAMGDTSLWPGAGEAGEETPRTPGRLLGTLISVGPEWPKENAPITGSPANGRSRKVTRVFPFS